MARKKSHKDVEFQVQVSPGHQRTFKRFDDAAAYAISSCVRDGDTKVLVDVLIYSRAGARWWGGDYAVEVYNEDPDASVSERLEITVNNVGRVY